MKVRWTDKALDNLQNIHDYIARDSRFYALRMVDRLTSRSKQIAFMPFSGRKVPEYQTENIRELIEEPYRIICIVPMLCVGMPPATLQRRRYRTAGAVKAAFPRGSVGTIKISCDTNYFGKEPPN